jgi:hypothetical protein
VTRTGNTAHCRADCLVLRRHAGTEAVMIDRPTGAAMTHGAAWARARTADGRVRAVSTCRICAHDPFVEADAREAAALERLLKRCNP